MAQYDHPIDVWNAALLRLGELPTQEGSADAEARIFRGVFDGVARSMMARHKFGFARKETKLNYKGEDQRDGYHLFQMPSDYLLIHSVSGHGQRSRHHEIRGDTLVAPYGPDVELFVLYTYYAPVSLWAPDFAEAVVTHCQGLLNKALREERVEGENQIRRADQLLLEAIARDKYANPPEKWIVPELPKVYSRSRNRRLPPVINTISSVR